MGPGWYPDPYFAGWLRFWDGRSWTGQVSGPDHPAQAQSHQPAATPSGELVAPAPQVPRPVSDAPLAPPVPQELASPVPAPEVAGRRRWPPRAVGGTALLVVAGLAALFTLPSGHRASTAGSSEATTPDNGVSRSASDALSLGEPARFLAEGQVIVEINVTAASVSSLVPSGGSAPADGYHATFTVHSTYLGRVGSLSIGPGDFYVEGPGGQHFGVSGGHGAAPGRPRALPDSAEAPGQSLTGTITIDEPSRHGLLVYAPQSRAQASWSF